MNSQDVLVRILTPSTSASKEHGPFIGYMFHSEGIINETTSHVHVWCSDIAEERILAPVLPQALNKHNPVNHKDKVVTLSPVAKEDNTNKRYVASTHLHNSVFHTCTCTCKRMQSPEFYHLFFVLQNFTTCHEMYTHTCIQIHVVQ